jgi:hypothetical protein
MESNLISTVLIVFKIASFWCHMLHDYIVIISFGCILYCVCFNLYYDGFKLFCNVCVCVCMCVCVCVCVGFVMCGCLDNVCTLNLYGYPDWGFSLLFPQLYGKCQGIISKDWARPALFQICYLCWFVCYSCCVVVNCDVLCIVYV